MNPSNKYRVVDTDIFNATDYPKVASELTVLRQLIWHLPSRYREEIIVSFLKDHKVKMDWILANPELVTLMTSGSPIISHLEHLFESCRDNDPFLSDFEKYIYNRLKRTSVNLAGNGLVNL